MNEVCQRQDCAWYLYLVGLERGSGRGNRKWCDRAWRLEGQQVVEGMVYISVYAGGNYCCVLEGCLLSLSL